MRDNEVFETAIFIGQLPPGLKNPKGSQNSKTYVSKVTTIPCHYPVVGRGQDQAKTPRGHSVHAEWEQNAFCSSRGGGFATAPCV